MNSPLEKFIEWYMSLPIPHRQSIAEFVIFFNIGFDDIDTTNMEELHNAFVKKLSKYSHDKLKGTGLALMLRANVDFLIRKWATREGWKESEEFLIGVKKHFSQPPVKNLWWIGRINSLGSCLSSRSNGY